MKKILWIVVALVVLFVALIYLSVSDRGQNYGTATIEEAEDLDNIDFQDHDSVLIAASSLYVGNVLKETMQGSNYRKAWSTPVKVPVVYLDTLFGGMEIVKEGGGSQTQSLRLRSDRGILYSLRSVNKDPDAHIPELARNLGLENIVIDGISAQHPYGAVAVAALADIAGILHTHPLPVFIPKQDFLEDFKDTYGNRLYLLEYETEGEINWTHHEDIIELMDTEDLQQFKQEDEKDVEIDRNAFVRARLFDLLIGDWDRHAKQWGWAVKKQNSGYIAIPIPGDRDNAFFKLEGVIPSLIANKSVEPLVRPFEEKIDYLPGLVYPVDIYFLKDTPEAVFIEEAENLQNALTDENIDNALRKLPGELYELDGQEILQKMSHRREDLLDYALDFRRLIEEKAYLTEPLKGSEDLELSPELMKCFHCEGPED